AATPDVRRPPLGGRNGCAARQELRLGQRPPAPGSGGGAEKELARLERRAGSRSGLLSGPLDHRLRQPVAIAEVLVRMVERRNRLEIETRERPDTARRPELCMLPAASFALGYVAREQGRGPV